jgi:hypothetical protein
MNKIKYKNLVSRLMGPFNFCIKISLKSFVFMNFFPQTDAFILKSVTELQNLVSACNWYAEPNRTQLLLDLADSV